MATDKTKGALLFESLMSAEADDKKRKQFGREITEGLVARRTELLARMAGALAAGDEEVVATARGNLRELDELCVAVVGHAALADEILRRLLDALRPPGSRRF